MEASAAVHEARQQGKRGRVKTQAACKRCQQLRTKCDAARPCCGSCTATGSACEYDTIDPSESRFNALRRSNVALQEELAKMTKSIDWLKSLPTQEALAWLQLLRSAQSPEELRQTLRYGMSRGVQATGAMSSQQAMSACLPTDRSLAGLELIEEIPMSYTHLDPEKHTDFLDSLWLDVLGGNSSIDKPGHTTTPSAPLELSQSTTNVDTYGSKARFIPGPKFAFHDSRLRALKIDYWTAVPISNQSAAMMISLYLQYEYDGFCFFDPELFVGDLINKRGTFCSPLLVNSLLSWTCRTFGFVDAESSVLGSMLFESAQALWQTERNVDSILTLASTTVLGLGANGGGHPVLAATLLVESVQMGERMGLFGKNRLSAEAFGFLSEDIASQYAWTAWGTFNLSVIETWYFRGKAIGMLATHPPLLPLPYRRNDSPEHHQDYPELTQYVAPAFTEIWAILHEVLMVYHDDYAPILERVPLAFAEAKFSQLMAWSRTLPKILHRRDEMPHYTAMLHIVFHAIITDIFRPFRRLYVQSLSFQFQYRIEDIFDCSAAQLRSLSLDYYCKHKSAPATHSVSWTTAVLWGANAVFIQNQRDQRADFVFFIQASANLLNSHPVMDRFIRGLLSMAVSADILSFNQARRVLERLERAVINNDTGEAGWVTDLNLAMEAPKSAVADVLAQRFNEMSVEQEASA